MKFGPYEIERRLAEGGMAEVYLARREGPAGFEKRVVLKLVLPHRAQDSRFVSMFLDEARLVARIDHPNVAQVFELGQHGGRYFIAMEYVDGEALSEIIDAANDHGLLLPLQYVARIVSRVAAGLDHAHHLVGEDGQPLGLVHRDVSPDNVMLSVSGAVKVIDFGVAKAAINLRQTQVSGPKGKQCYMSPEQARGRPVDGRSDVFSLGIVLYQLTTGYRPFGTPSGLDAVSGILDDRPAPPSKKRDQVPEAFDAIVMRALEKDVRERYQRAGELQRDLERFIGAHSDVVGDEQLAELVNLVRRGEAQDAALLKRRQREVSVVPIPTQPSAPLAAPSPVALAVPAALPPGAFRKRAAAGPGGAAWLLVGAVLGLGALALIILRLALPRTTQPDDPRALTPVERIAAAAEPDALDDEEAVAPLPSGPLVLKVPLRHQDGPRPVSRPTPETLSEAAARADASPAREIGPEAAPEVRDSSTLRDATEATVATEATDATPVVDAPPPPPAPTMMRWPTRLTVTANLSGAEVWAGHRLGLTPLKNASVYEGTYDLEVRAGPVVWRRRLAISGQGASVHADLAAGKVELAGVPPGANCQAGGTKVGATFFAATGSLEVSCSDGSQVVWSRTLRVAPGSTLRVDLGRTP
jgi:serine/threonine-protein kinase